MGKVRVSAAPGFRVCAVPNKGFWRCGRHWSSEGVVLGEDALTKEEWERLRAEPNLRVEPVRDTPDAGD